MLTAAKRRLDRDDEGFTLIELMVVLLIIAILLAIAIPTFLGARNSANARSTQENLRNALTAEQSHYTGTQAFSTDLSLDEPSLSWETGAAALTEGGRDVFASLPNGDQGVLLEGYAKDGNCYAIYQSNNPTADYTAYTAAKGACDGTIAAPGPAASAPTTAGNGTVAATGASAVWYTGW